MIGQVISLNGINFVIVRDCKQISKAKEKSEKKKKEKKITHQNNTVFNR